MHKIPDIDECVREEPPCHTSAVCLNNEGSFTCTCAEGYEGDGIIDCQGIYNEKYSMKLRMMHDNVRNYNYMQESNIFQ